MKLTKKIRNRLVWVGLLCTVGSVVSVMTVDFLAMLDGTEDRVEAVYVSRPSPVASAPMLPMRSVNRYRFAGTGFSETGVAVPMGSTGGAISLLSQTQVNHVGGGLYTVSEDEQERHKSRPSGGGAVMPMTTFYAMASTREMAAPGAAGAPQMAKVTPRKGLNPPVIGDDDDPENPDIPQPPVPVGGAIGVMFMLSLGYAMRKRDSLIKR